MASKYDPKQDEDENLGKTKMGTCQKFVKFINMLVFVGDLSGVVINACCMAIGIKMILTPIKDHVVNHSLDRIAYRAFWGMQGGILFWGSFISFFATIWFGVLNKNMKDLPQFMKPQMCCGFFQYELGRAVFLILTGLYCYTFMSAFEMVAIVPGWLWVPCKIVGVLAVQLGVFMAIFDVLFDCLDTPRFHPLGGRRQDPHSHTDAEVGKIGSDVEISVTINAGGGAPGELLIQKDLPITA